MSKHPITPERVRRAVDDCDTVAVERIVDAVLQGDRPSGHIDDRLAAAVECVRRGRRATFLHRLGLSGTTQRVVREVAAS